MTYYQFFGLVAAIGFALVFIGLFGSAYALHADIRNKPIFKTNRGDL